MKSIQHKFFRLLGIAIVANLFVACSNEQTTYLDEDTNLQETKAYSVCDASFLQINNTDYEVIPIGTNNYVYVPKMTSTKATTRSAEMLGYYSATIQHDDLGGLSITITWDANHAVYRLSDGYMCDHKSFRYRINGRTLVIDELWLNIYGGNGFSADFEYTGTLIGS